ncbi:MAG: ATP-binding protein [Actinomycetota bacterium]|nr:ATP-binding protein [Actinomycetota bacterium]
MARTHDDLQLPSAPTSVGEARRFVAAALDALGAHGVQEVAALLTSELVTNAVVHVGGAIRIRVTGGAGTVRIAVEDASPAKPQPREAGDRAVTGRGLNLVEQLAERWGVDDVDGGKVVWFELRA